MKKIFCLLFSALVISVTTAQLNIDSLRWNTLNAEQDTVRLKSLVWLADHYKWYIPDSSIYYAMQGLELAKKLGDEKQEMELYFHMGEALSGKGNFALALNTHLKSLSLAEKSDDPTYIIWAMVGIGSVYFYSHDYQSALTYYKKLKLDPQTYMSNEAAFSAFIGETYFHLGEIDSAFVYINRSYELIKENPRWSVPYYYMGKIHAARNQYIKALDFYRQGIYFDSYSLSKIEGYNGIAEIFNKMGVIDSAIYYAGRGLDISKQLSFSNKAIESSYLLKEAYKKMGQTDSAFKYQEIMLAEKDSLYSQEKVKQMQNFSFNEQMKQQEIIAEKKAYRSRMKIYGLIALGVVLLVIAVMLWRNNRYKQRAFNLLQQQKLATDKLRDKTEQALYELKATQAQLIQSEKMASLGELTAGIAHEIQNPLNFVNNFSDMNKELLDEMNDELDKGNIREAKEIAKTVVANEEKIVQHGKRADAIVKGMLQHSRTSSGQKELTDINVLAEEYLRLAYHGLRAKDKSFNAKFETDLDPSIEKINIVPQDIGRVLLNLVNNAFYAVTEKSTQQLPGYEPTVTIRTKKLPGQVEIRVRDNGNGVPDTVKEKIFQPFFTTKPTGKGTGLGLSLSYDIITKVHAGQMKADSREGEFAEFIIQLPI